MFSRDDTNLFYLDINKLDPEKLLLFEDLKRVKVKEGLLEGLDLTLTYKGALKVTNKYKFDYDFVTEEEEFKKFRKFLLNKGGYLDNEGNYFDLDSGMLSDGTEANVMTNLRVTVFTRDFNLSNLQLKRVQSLGFGFLLEAISESELVFWINNIVKGNFDLTIVHAKLQHVRIGFEKPLFT